MKCYKVIDEILRNYYSNNLTTILCSLKFDQIVKLFLQHIQIVSLTTQGLRGNFITYIRYLNSLSLALIEKRVWKLSKSENVKIVSFKSFFFCGSVFPI